MAISHWVGRVMGVDNVNTTPISPPVTLPNTVILPGIGVYTNTAKQGEQYVLVAARSGFYPVMEFGSRLALAGKYLRAGEVWKYRITVNPSTRYSQNFLRNTGRGLLYNTQFEGTMEQCMLAEGMKIIIYMIQNNGQLPPGNKKVM